ncbi:hypothetical protein D3C78_1382600 [compost metagenome]
MLSSMTACQVLRLATSDQGMAMNSKGSSPRAATAAVWSGTPAPPVIAVMAVVSPAGVFSPLLLPRRLNCKLMSLPLSPVHLVLRVTTPSAAAAVTGRSAAALIFKASAVAA